MSKLLEFFLGSLLIAVFTIALMFFSALQYVLRTVDTADCMWQGSARTWIDSNGDGLMNHEELPLADVQIHVNDMGNGLADVAWPVIAGKDGEARFNAPMPECLETVFEIHVEVPEGYRLTTKSHIEVTPKVWERLTAERVYYFGFIPDK